MAAGHEWRTLANRPGFPHVPFFHPQPAAAHFPPHMLHLDQNRSVLGLSNRKLINANLKMSLPHSPRIHRNVLLTIKHVYRFIYMLHFLHSSLCFIVFSGATTPQTQLNNQSIASNNNNNNPHSTTSPNSSPANVSLTNSSQLTPPPHTDENDNTMNDDTFENDNISVTGSPAHANSTEDDERRSPSPFRSSPSTIPLPPPSSQITTQTDTLGNGGAFTSLIQRNTKKSDFLSNFQTHLHQRPTAVSAAAAAAAAAASAHPSLHPQLPQQNHHSALNHALAAQLFLQSPLMPQPSQWLYSQLYGANYNELPWLRTTLQSTNGNRLMAGCANNTSAETILTQSNHPLCTDVDAIERGGGGGDGNGVGGGGANRRCVTLISHLDDEKEASASPPVTSTKRTPSPHDDIEIVCNTSPVKPSKGDSSLKCRTPKHVDVWRPY